VIRADSASMPRKCHRDDGMTALIAEHNVIAALLPKDRPVAFLDYPLGINVGDLLIMLGTLAFFERHGLQRRLSRNLLNTETKGSLGIQEGDTIVLQGGGNFGDLYPHIQAYRERIIAEYPDNKIVVMPQTIYYIQPDGLGRAADRLNRHPDLTLVVRDTVSYDLAKPFFGERLIPSPDMAHELWPSLLATVNGGEAHEGPLFFMRTDEEKGRVFEAFDAHRPEFVDWANVVTMRLRLIKRTATELSRLQSVLNSAITPDELYFTLVRTEVVRTVRKLAGRTPWITSRLHGFILGLLLDKPVAAVDNNYGKLSSYIETWGAWMQPAVLVRTEADAAEIAALAVSNRSESLWEGYAALARTNISGTRGAA
jgi:pyruvyl transferase EpsO